MASSMFHSISKYRKLWITVLMVLSMITFVLCAGNKADLSESLIQIQRFPSALRGRSAATVNGTSLYREDLERYKTQRLAANTYMRSLSEQLIELVTERSKNLLEKLDDEMQKAASTRFCN